MHAIEAASRFSRAIQGLEAPVRVARFEGEEGLSSARAGPSAKERPIARDLR
jgi:hypothetical protein